MVYQSEFNLSVIPNAAKQVLYKLLQDASMTDYDLEITSCIKKGDNFIGILYRILAKNSSKQVLVICKTEPESEVRRQEFRTSMLFEREILVYKDLFPLYEELQKDHKVSESSKFNNYPKILGFGDGFLFMNDLQEQGYQMVERWKTLDYEHLDLTVKALARFHAVGLATKIQKPEEFKNVCHKITEDYFGKPLNNSIYCFIKAMIREASGTLEENEDDIKNRLIILEDKIEDVLPKLLTKDCEPYAVFTHGDFWNNNVMFKYKDNKPVEVSLIDYQLCRYASPALDLSYLIFCSTSKSLRDQYYSKILTTYHAEFSSTLQNLQLNCDTYFPFQVLKEQMEQFGTFGIIMAIMQIKSMMCADSNVVAVEDISEMMRDQEDYTEVFKIDCGDKDKLYKERMSDCLRDAFAWNML